MGSRLYALSKALIAFRFCTRIGPTEAQVFAMRTRPQQMFLYRVYRGAEVPRRPNVTRFHLANYSFHPAHTWHQFVVREAALQMVKISKRYQSEN